MSTLQPSTVDVSDMSDKRRVALSPVLRWRSSDAAVVSVIAVGCWNDKGEEGWGVETIMCLVEQQRERDKKWPGAQSFFTAIFLCGMLGFTWTCVSRGDGVDIDHLASSTASFYSSISSDYFIKLWSKLTSTHLLLLLTLSLLLKYTSSRITFWLWILQFGWGTILLE